MGKTFRSGHDFPAEFGFTGSAGQTHVAPHVRGAAKGGWIKGAIKKPGALHAQLGIPQGEKIPASTLQRAAKAPGKLGQRARLAETLKKMNHASGGRVKTLPVAKVSKAPGALTQALSPPSVRSRVSPKMGIAGLPNYAMRARLPGGRNRGGPV